ncbi:SDR family NAD(P)-dependent oxidoreductase [Isoptericola cucumis]|uniref:SDR family NAD(P)-dependent oxidoreductase n=1 Tax=Isoptericola cucumis TaxID=1776856 RepID=UPI003208F164
MGARSAGGRGTTGWTTGRTTVVAGGTAGLGLGIALGRLEAGDAVTVVGRDAPRGEAFLERARAAGADSRARFVAGDLTTAAGAWDVVDRVQERHDVVDALVLTAFAPQLRRRVTGEGVETSLSLYYLARRVLGEGLGPQLDRAARPVIVSLNGVGVVHGRVHWDDLTLERRYRALEATTQGGRAAELLAVAHANAVPERRARYVLAHPGFTRTAATGLPWAARALTRVAALAAQPVGRAVSPVLALVDEPPAAPLTAIDRGRPVDLGTFADRAAAARLEEVMRPFAARPAPA